MSGVSAASHLASTVRAAMTDQARAARNSVKPENAGRVQISSETTQGSHSSMQFDATGQVVPSAKGVHKGSATDSFVDLLA